MVDVTPADLGDVDQAVDALEIDERPEVDDVGDLALDDLTRLQSRLHEHREGERNLRNTLLTAQKLADEIRNNAEAEGKRLVREAEGRADLMLSKAQARLDEVQREIDGLRLKRRDVENSLEATIAALHKGLIEDWDVAPQPKLHAAA